MDTIKTNILKKALVSGTEATDFAISDLVKSIVFLNRIIAKERAYLDGEVFESYRDVEAHMCFNDDFRRAVEYVRRRLIKVNRECKTAFGDFAFGYLRSDAMRPTLETDEAVIRFLSAEFNDMADNVRYVLDHPKDFGIEE